MKIIIAVLLLAVLWFAHGFTMLLNPSDGLDIAFKAAKIAALVFLAVELFKRATKWFS